MNSYTLAGLINEIGAIAMPLGIVKDNRDELFNACNRAVSTADMVLISGGSSVGMRDFTVDVLSDLTDTELLVHGISISPGKPTILARSGNKPVWGLPGHVVSAMVVFKVVVLPFLRKLMGEDILADPGMMIPAILTRNVASAQGRTDFVRVALRQGDGQLHACPGIGKVRFDSYHGHGPGGFLKLVRMWKAWKKEPWLMYDACKTYHKRIMTRQYIAPDGPQGLCCRHFHITAMGRPYSDLVLPTTKHERVLGLSTLSYKLPRADLILTSVCPQRSMKEY